jgi:hypothetical protein
MFLVSFRALGYVDNHWATIARSDSIVWSYWSLRDAFQGLYTLSFLTIAQSFSPGTLLKYGCRFKASQLLQPIRQMCPFCSGSEIPDAPSAFECRYKCCTWPVFSFRLSQLCPQYLRLVCSFAPASSSNNVRTILARDLLQHMRWQLSIWMTVLSFRIRIRRQTQVLTYVKSRDSQDGCLSRCHIGHRHCLE